MSYTVLARRYRSSTFDEVVGQAHVAQTLKRAIESGRIAHAYMFCGTRGTGKTSMARILAKALNCDNATGPTTTPCGECRSCQGIARGDDMDVIEMDAASNRGIDEVRKIIENSRLCPSRGRFKIYIIDEVHALTKEAFNSLLKVLEEPASHVKFILATTEPEKVLATILSRCQRYDFHNIPVRQIADHLKSVCEKEGVQADQDALLMLARAGNGSMRDAISVLDRMLSAGDSKLTGEMVEQLLGMPRTQLIYDLTQKIGQGDVRGALEQLQTMLATGLSPDTLLASMVEHLRNLMVVRACGAKSDLIEATTIPVDELATQAQRFELVFLTQDIVILEELRRQIRQSQAGRALLDAAIVRLALSEQFTPISQLTDDPSSAMALPAAQKKKPELSSPAQPQSLGSPVAAQPIRPATFTPPTLNPPSLALPPISAPRPRIMESGGGAPVAAPSHTDAQPASGPDHKEADAPSGELLSHTDPEPASDSDDADSLPAVGKVHEGPKRSMSAIFAEKMKAAAATAAASVAASVAAIGGRGGPSPDPASATSSSVAVAPPDNSDLAAVWHQLLDAAAELGSGLAVPLAQGRLLRIDNDQAVIHFSHAMAGLAHVVQFKHDALRDKLQTILDRPVSLRIQTGDAPVASAATVAAPAVRNHPPRLRPAEVNSDADADATVSANPAPASGPPQDTPEIRRQVAQDPLVRGVMDTLGGTIIRVEHTDV